jgi:SAM-dependent methyltransferase
MKNGGTGVSTGSEQERAAWAERVEGYAREAAAKNRPFAEALVDMVSPRSGDRVLDVATGPGIVAVEAARRVGPQGSVLATDFIPDWEPYVTDAARAAGVTNVAFAVMPAEALDLPDQSQDVVLCQFGLMFVPDPLRALREMRRVLRRGGKLGIAVWSVPEKVGLFLVPRIIGAALPPPAGAPPPSPMSMGAPGLVEGLVEEAGYRDVVIERQTRWHEIANAEDEWRRWSEDTASPTARGLATLPKTKQQMLKSEAIAALEALRDGEVIRVPSEAILVMATR